MMRSWSETQAMAERAARGAGVRFAQAARFGAAAARHLAEGRAETEVLTVLDHPDVIEMLSLDVERTIEESSLGRHRHAVSLEPKGLVQSYFEALPCATDVTRHAEGLVVQLALNAPTQRKRSTRIEVSDQLWQRMEGLASVTYVPDSDASRDKGAGAGLMELD